MDYPGYMEDKETARYLAYLGKETLKLGKDIALCPANYVLPLAYGVFTQDFKIMVASFVMAVAAGAYCIVHDAIYSDGKKPYL
jgi:hypothetical protein